MNEHCEWCFTACFDSPHTLKSDAGVGILGKTHILYHRLYHSQSEANVQCSKWTVRKENRLLNFLQRYGKIHPNSKDPLYPPISPSIRRRIFEQTLVTTGCAFVRVPTLKLDNQEKICYQKGGNFIPGVPWWHIVNQWYNPCLSSIVQSFPRNKRCLVPPKHPITGAVTSHNPQRPCPVAQISCPGLKVARCWWPWRMLQMEIVEAFKHKSILNK